MNIYSRRYLHDIISSPDTDLSDKDAKSMKELRKEHPDIAMITVHVSFCNLSLALNWKDCIVCNVINQSKESR